MASGRATTSFGPAQAFLVVAPNDRDGFNMNVVDAGIPERISRRFKGRSVTSKALSKNKAGQRFSALNGLYVMVATDGRARRLKRLAGRSMVFKIG